MEGEVKWSSVVILVFLCVVWIGVVVMVVYYCCEVGRGGWFG